MKRWDGTLKDLRKEAKKRKVAGQHCYAVGLKYANRKRPSWYRHVVLARNKEELLDRLVSQYNLPRNMIVIKLLE